MKPESTLDTLEPRHIPASEEGNLTQVPNADRFDTPEESSEPQTEEKQNERIAKAKETIRKSADEIAGKTREALQKRGDELTEKTGTHLRDVEKSAKAAAEKLKDGEPSYLSGPVEKFSETVADVADYFEKNDADAVMEDGKEIVRKYPAAVLGGLAFAGFLAGRYIKASQKDS